ncbi:MAG: hypothetical protein WC735_01740 [Candidatus Paceibacterota bacterium]|jgi:hypothetical protein
MEYKSQNTICQNCKQDFTIESEDFNFYEKIKVPPPTFCPECRAVRRMIFRNERALYKRKCDFSDQDIITPFSADNPCKVYEREIWWSDKWDPLESGQNYDFSKPFFIQWKELLMRAPLPSLFNSRISNSFYCNHCGEIRSSYLTFASWEVEDILFSAKTFRSKGSMDLLACSNTELSYDLTACEKMYGSVFCENCENCVSCYFLYECKGCTDCIGCVNLRSKSYCIFNKQYSKEDYDKEVKKMNLHDYKGFNAIKEKFINLRRESIRKFATFYNAQNCTGDNLANASNCKFCFDLKGGIRDTKFAINGGVQLEDSYDGYGFGGNASQLYEGVDTGADGARLFFTIFVWGGNDVYYSYASHGCGNVFGCIGLRQKQYCILNKQYTKEEYSELVPKIIKHMNDMPYVDKEGKIYKYGEFFPAELSPFAYNETIAQEYFPLTKTETLKQGYRWKEGENRTFKINIKTEDIPNDIGEVSEDVIGKVIECEHKGKCNEQCTEAFKIIKDELSFYKRMNLPLPHMCPNCRHYTRQKQRNPLKLWHRSCMCDKKNHIHGAGKCEIEFETSYAPDRPEIVYCEKCYQAEVY